jgi:SSS family transporter
MSDSGLAVFLGLVAITLVITWWAGRRNNSVGSHYVASNSVSGRQNGLAIVGDAISASTFLGTVGAMSLTGFNAYFLALFTPLAYVLSMFLIAEPLRNLGRYTMADMVSARFPRKSVRGVMAASSASISVLYIVAQYIAGALLVSLLFDINYTTSVAIIAVLTTVYSMVGGMLATTWIQIVKASLMLVSCALLLVLVLEQFGWNPLNVFAAADGIEGINFLSPTRTDFTHGIDQVSLAIGLILGVLGLPHVMIRFLTVKDARQARISASTATWAACGILITFPFIAYGGFLLLGRDAITSASASGNLMVPLLAQDRGGDLLLAFVSAVAVSTILASLSGMLIATTGAVAHDIYNEVLRSGRASQASELLVARITTVVTAAIALVVSMAAKDQNIAVLATLAIAVSASSNLPALVGTLYVRGVTAVGVFVGMAAGLVTAVMMIALSPTFFGADAPVSLVNPGIVSIPVAFLAMYIGSRLSAPRGTDKDIADGEFAAVRFQAVVGRALRGREPSA